MGAVNGPITRPTVAGAPGGVVGCARTAWLVRDARSIDPSLLRWRRTPKVQRSSHK